MFNELTIKTPFGDFLAYLQDGFYINSKGSNYHNHNYAEIHVVVGDCEITVEGTPYALCGANMLVIPPDRYHSTTGTSDDVKHIAFQINRDFGQASVYPINSELAEEFFEKLYTVDKYANHASIALYLAFFVGTAFSQCEIVPRYIEDPNFLIHEFISLNYHRDASLRELAEILHLSERQAQRLVRARYGKSFRSVLSSTRIEVPKRLITSTNASLSEIAAAVGYRSYAGFWKAFKEAQ